MRIVGASKVDATHLAHIIHRLYVCDKLLSGLKVAGIEFEGESFDSRLHTNAWLEVHAKEVARQVAPEAKAETPAEPTKRRKSSNVKQTSPKKKAKKK